MDVNSQDIRVVQLQKMKPRCRHSIKKKAHLTAKKKNLSVNHLEKSELLEIKSLTTTRENQSLRKRKKAQNLKGISIPRFSLKLLSLQLNSEHGPNQFAVKAEE